jgi:hypothetical protein
MCCKQLYGQGSSNLSSRNGHCFCLLLRDLFRCLLYRDTQNRFVLPSSPVDPEVLVFAGSNSAVEADDLSFPLVPDRDLKSRSKRSG